MSLAYIITQVCDKLGYDPVHDRDFLITIINAGCKEVYEKTDLPDCLRELTALALANNTVAIPYYIGEMRAMRGHFTFDKIELREMAARYSYKNWPQIWNNWRVIKKSPLKKSIINAAYPIIVTLENPCDTEVIITITGQTTTANKKVEVLTIPIGQVSTQLVNNFVDIYSITKPEPCSEDITFTGVDENLLETELAVFYNDQLSSIYTIVDISLLPFGGNCGTAFRYVDVLFKSPLPRLVEDGEEFICVGYDDAIVAKVCEHFYSKQENGINQALGWSAKCEQLISQTIEHSNGATDKEMVFAPGQFLGLYPRFGRRRGWGYNGQGITIT